MPYGPKGAAHNRGASPAGPFGEIVISADRAVEEARRRRLDPRRELLLYAVHGMLHLVGYDDATPAARARMRRREAEVLRNIEIRMSKSETISKAAMQQ